MVDTVEQEARGNIARDTLTNAMNRAWVWSSHSTATKTVVLLYPREAWNEWAAAHPDRSQGDVETWVSSHGIILTGATAEEVFTNALAILPPQARRPR